MYITLSIDDELKIALIAYLQRLATQPDPTTALSKMFMPVLEQMTSKTGMPSTPQKTVEEAMEDTPPDVSVMTCRTCNQLVYYKSHPDALQPILCQSCFAEIIL